MSILDIFRKKPDTAKDPICHMLVDKSNSQFTSQYKGTTYYFCAPGCKHMFDENPNIHLNSDPPAIKM